MVLYTVAEVAEMLKLTTKTVYELIKSGKISVTKIGGSIRISESELKRVLEEGA